MKEYELVTESFNPCAGTARGETVIDEITADDPVEYVKQHTKSGSISGERISQETVEITVDDKGYIKKYTFTEI